MFFLCKSPRLHHRGNGHIITSICQLFHFLSGFQQIHGILRNRHRLFSCIGIELCNFAVLHGHRKQTFQSADFLFRVCHDLFAILMVHRKCHDGIHGKSGGFVAIFLFRLGKHLLCLFSFFRAASQYKYRCQHKGCCFFPIHVCSFSFCMTCSNFILHSKKLPVK